MPGMLAPMDPMTRISHLLANSSDPGNPSPEELSQLLDDVQHIAVVGLSRDPEKAARRVPSYMAAKGYDVIPVNPNATRLLGRSVYPSLMDVPDAVDMVMFFRPSHLVGPFVEEAMKRPGTPALWLQQGIRADPEIEVARKKGHVCVQDLCIFRVHRALEG